MDHVSGVAKLYEDEGERVLMFLTRRTWDPEVALELTAETFSLAIGSWGRVGSLTIEQQRAWLFTVARRLLSRYARRARIERRAVERLGAQVPSMSPDEAAEIERRAGLEDLRALITTELATLSADQRDALRLRVVEDRPYEEVAALMGVSEQTARARVSRALRRLGDALEPHREHCGEAGAPRASAAAQEGAS